MKHSIILSAFLLLFIPTVIQAVPAYNQPITINQADGSTLTIRLHGDEFFHYRTSLDGYLVQEHADGLYYYASFDAAGKLTAERVQAKEIAERTTADQQFLRNLQTADAYLDLIETLNQERRQTKQKAPSALSAQQNYPLSGNPRSLVILVNFTDRSFAIPNPQQAFSDLLNQQGYSANGATGSAKDYFRDNSAGAFNPVFDVVGPYDLPNNMTFYGGNDKDGDDKNPRQMVIDACNLASADGVNFAQYDTDNDGFIDNVFIYYAGYNEAEGGAANTIWPHRWSLPNYLTKIDGKVLFDYACTSELRGYYGTNMCGIGTFVHEFSHVLGLPDFYPTDGSNHHTLSDWDVMDAGPYLNQGRTPPAYSAYERFFLGWLTPTLLDAPQDVVLDTLLSANQAYLISSTHTHNLKGNQPNPTEFFLLENRQQAGWDAFLPGHGMLITRVFYNANNWIYNTVNNQAAAMGVDIIEADSKANTTSFAGDPFPGTSNVTTFYPKLRNGTDINKPLYGIAETNGIISFKFSELLAPEAKPAEQISPTSFVATWEAVPNAEKYVLDVFNKHVNDTIFLVGFMEKDMGTETSVLIENLYAQTPYYYRVKAVVGEYVSSYSNTIEVLTIPHAFEFFQPTALEADELSAQSFKAAWTWHHDLFTPQSYELTVFTQAIGDSLMVDENAFSGGVLPNGWSGEIDYSTTSGYYGAAIPAAYLTEESDYVQSPVYDQTIQEISFWYRGRGTLGAFALNIYASADGANWDLMKTISPVPTTVKTITITDDEIPTNCKSIKFKFVRPGATGNLALDDIQIGTEAIESFPLAAYDAKNVGNVMQYQVQGLDSETDYFYYVRAVLGEEFSAKSNVVSFTTHEATALKEALDMPGIKLIKLTDGIELIAEDENCVESFTLYSITGQKLHEAKLQKNNFIPLPSNNIYLVKIGDKVMKF